jgi:xanthine dehydrogenase molybdenum-binding subunit
MSAAHRYIGQRIPRRDALEKVTGRAQYAADLRLPGMLHAKVLRSPHAHAIVGRIRAERALALPGVRAIVTCHDIPRQMASQVSAIPSGKFAVKDGRVRFIGEPVAAIAAVDEDLAEEAAALIEVDYEVLPAVFTPDEALLPEAPRLYDGGNVLAVIPISFGDLERGLAEADHVLERRYETSKVMQCPLEPFTACVADYSATGRLTVWSSHQRPYEMKQMLAHLVGLPASRIRVMKPFTGGGFGARDGATDMELMCATLAMKAAGPVSLRCSREEDFIASESRHPCVLSLRAGVRRDGTLTAMDLRAVLDTGAYGRHAVGVAASMGIFLLRMYRCPNIRYEGTVVHTNNPAAGAFRGYGNPQVTFAVESHMDEIARDLGLDPLDLRLRNVPRDGDYDPFFKIPFQGMCAEECLRRGAARIGWPRPERARGEGAKVRGVGMAYTLHVSGMSGLAPSAASAIVQWNVDGSIHLLTSAADEGQGSLTVFAQIVAETLGAPMDQVMVTGPDTDVTPYDAGTYGSRQAYAGGWVVREAALRARAALLSEASRALGADPDDLDLADGRIHVKSAPDRSMSTGDLLLSLQISKDPRQIIGVASGQPPSNAPACAAHFAEVEVDTETGQVRVLRFVAVHDIGVALNPDNVEGQIYGGIQQGIGYALMEQLVLEQGKVQNPSFEGYKIPSAPDMPEIEILLHEGAASGGPFGAKGVGEIPAVPPAAAIANAISDAVGVRIRDLPLLQEKIHAAMAAARRDEDAGAERESPPGTT